MGFPGPLGRCQKDSGALFISNLLILGLARCRSECKLAQQACWQALRGNDDSFVSLLGSSASIVKLKKAVCKKACRDKKLPKLIDWHDEKFEPRENEDIDRETTQLSMEKLQQAAASAGVTARMKTGEEL